jgi:hypothetical protein
MANKFKGFSVEGAEEVTVASNSVQGKTSKVFSPGLHTVRIRSVQEKGAVQSDSTWQRLWITLEGTAGKTISTGVSYPTESLMFAGEANKYPAQQFIALVQALGYDSGSKNLPAVLAKLFSEPAEALLDLELQVNIGYKGNHVVPSNGKFLLVQKYGRPMTEDGEELVFDSRDAAEQWCKDNGKEYHKFPEVLGFVPAEELSMIAVPTKAASAPSKKAF